MINCNQNAWLKTYVDMDTELRQKAKNNFEKDLFKLMNPAVFGKTMKNMSKHINIELATTENRRNHLVLKPNCHTTKFFTKYLLAMEKIKSQRIINKPVYLVLSILHLQCINFAIIMQTQNITKM